MRRSPGRAQVEPTAALAAVFAVGAALALYAGVVDDARRTQDPTDVPDLALDGIEAEADADGVLVPGRVAPGAVTPPGWQVNVTLRTPTRTYRWGPAPPNETRRAERPVPVRLGPGRVRTGRLAVETWR